MTSNVVGFPKGTKKPRVTYRGFAKAFRRVHVDRQLMPVRADEREHFPRLESPPMDIYTARYDGPGENYREARLHALRDLGLAPELLVYRVLRELFGPPDNITAAIPADYKDHPRELRDGEGPFILEWGFMLAGQSDAVYEVRKQPGTQQPHLAVWLPTLASVAPDGAALLVSEFKQFVRELRKTLDSSQSMIDKRELKKESAPFGPINIYGDLLAAGDEQVATAADITLGDHVPTASQDASAAIQRQARSSGTFYMAAAIQYLLALEAFVNVTSELLRKDQFADAIFNRMTREADFESRLLSLSLFCRGFERAPFTPDTPLFKRIRELRKFRNEVLHGSFSHDEHVVRVLMEDHYLFYWWPAVDERSLATQDTSRISLPLSRKLFTKRHADLVRQEVEGAVDLIIGAMQPDYRAWAGAWRSSAAIPAVLSADGWRPTLDVPSSQGSS